jgi:hypothetical protein
MKHIILFTGYARSGKDTSADFLSEYGFVKLAIASKLKQIINVMFNINCEEIEKQDKQNIPMDELNGLTLRQTKQLIGTELLQHNLSTIMPNLGRNYHIKQLVDYINKSIMKRICICDLRFPHELDYINKHIIDAKIITIRIIRPSLNTNTEIYKHSSENSINEIKTDLTIINEDLQKLKLDVINVLTQIKIET